MSNFPVEIPTAISRDESEVLARYAAGKVVLEVGAWHGYSTVVMGLVADFVVSVDHHQGDAHSGLEDTLDSFMGFVVQKYGLGGKVDVRVGHIEVVASTLMDDCFDVAFLDAYHTEEAVLRHLRIIQSKVKVGGHMLAHDFGVESGAPPGHFGVHRGVYRWLAHQPQPGALWVQKGVEAETMFVGRRVA